MDTDRIARMELTPLRVPFRPEVLEILAAGAGGIGMALQADEPWTGGDFVHCRVTSESGASGVGEVFVWLPETGQSPRQLVGVVADALAPYVLGADPMRIEDLRDRMDRNLARSDVAKGLVDLAVHELRARLLGVGVCDLVGGRTRDRLPLAAVLPLTEVSVVADLARMAVDQGVRTLRLKLGEGVRADVAQLEAVREAVGDEIRLRVDYNQAYDAHTAVRAVRAIAGYGIDVVEQPVAADDVLGMRHVQRALPDVPVMAHEGAFGLVDLVTHVELGGAGAIGVNTERPGGLTNALRAIDYAERRGLGVVIHNQPLGVGSAELAHLAAARWHSLGGHAIELFGHIMLSTDLLVERMSYDDGMVTVPTGPGWGVEVDEDLVADHATAEPTVLTA